MANLWVAQRRFWPAASDELQVVRIFPFAFFPSSPRPNGTDVTRTEKKLSRELIKINHLRLSLSAAQLQLLISTNFPRSLALLQEENEGKWHKDGEKKKSQLKDCFRSSSAVSVGDASYRSRSVPVVRETRQVIVNYIQLWLDFAVVLLSALLSSMARRSGGFSVNEVETEHHVGGKI